MHAAEVDLVGVTVGQLGPANSRQRLMSVKECDFAIAAADRVLFLFFDLI